MTRQAGGGGRRWLPLALLAGGALLAGCRREAPRQDRLVVAGYTAVQGLLQGELIPELQRRWQARAGRPLEVEQSYLGSSAQARAILSGFGADVAVLSMEPDVQRLVDAGLVSPSWSSGPSGGMVSRTLVVLAVRKGNPLGLRDFGDLARPEVELLTPDPRSSGGGMWNLAAVLGAARRAGAGDGGLAALTSALRRMRAMDKGARESIISFERGVGNAAITYQSEVRAAVRSGAALEEVIPPRTLLIENPAVVVEANARRHGAGEAAAAFLELLASEDGPAAGAGGKPVAALSHFRTFALVVHGA